MQETSMTPTTWPTNSQVTLCRVAWDNSYKDVVYFDSEEDRKNYFSSLDCGAIKLTDYTYLKPNEPIMLGLPYSACYTYNYCFVDNPLQPVPNEVYLPRFYYFITSVAMLNPSTTAITLQLDVFQTYLYKFKVNKAFVVRGHAGVQAAYNCPYKYNPASWRRYCSVPEGLDIGSDYTIQARSEINLSYNSNNNVEDRNGLALIIQSSGDLAADWGTESKPSFKTSDGQFTDGIETGCNVYEIGPDNFKNLCDKLRDAPWVARTILSITVFPKLFLTDGPDVKLNGIPAKFLGTTPDEGVFYTANDRIYDILKLYLPDVYHKYFKLFTYPYAFIELANFTGSPVIYKPEYFNTEKVTLSQVTCAAPPYMRIAVYPNEYGRNIWFQGATGDYEEGLNKVYFVLDDTKPRRTKKTRNDEYLNNALWFNNLPTLSIVNDNYLLYMASTVNTRTWQYQSAGWSQTRSNAQTAMSYDQAQASLANNQANMDVQNTSRIANAALGAVGSLTGGNVGGALMGAVGAGVDYWAANEQFNNNQALQSQFATQNADLARWAAKGDYQNAIAGINATVQDAQLTAPSVVGQAGGDGFNLANGNFAIQITYKVINQDYMYQIAQYFSRYGYAIHEFFTPPEDFKCMANFTYWQMQETYLDCAQADEGVKETLRGIFEKGVTVWNDPAKIGNIDVWDNDIIEGVRWY